MLDIRLSCVAYSLVSDVSEPIIPLRVLLFLYEYSFI